MKRVVIGLLAIAVSLTACNTGNSEKYPNGIEHVVIIGLDGTSPDGIRNAKTPVMDSMIANGSVKWNVRTVLSSSSSQNWASMIMGAGPEQHGVINNDWERNEHSLPPIVKGEEGIFPTIFSVIRENKPDAEIGAVYNWSGFGRLFEKKAVNYDVSFKTEDSTAQHFVEYLVRKKPVFSFIHFDHVDHAGHAYGHGTEAYYQAVSKADSLISNILAGIKAAGMEQNTLVIITSDHGGIGYGHGGATPEEAEIAMILYGKDIKKGYKVQQQVYTYDLAATIAFALKIVPPYAWIGRPVKSAFEGFAEPKNLWLGKETIASPVIYPKRNLYQQPGGLYINQVATVKIESGAENAEIHYTLDGSDPVATSPIYKEAFTIDTTTVVKATTFNKNGDESLPATAYFRSVKAGAGNGLLVKYYPGKDWKQLPLFNKLSPAQEWNSYEFSIKREQIMPLLKNDNSNFGLVFNGFIEIDSEGDYTFYTQSDDGSKLYINNQEVVDNDGGHGLIERSGKVHLAKGKHPIRVEYFNDHGGFWLEAFYKGPGITKQIIPPNKLFLKN